MRKKHSISIVRYQTKHFSKIRNNILQKKNSIEPAIEVAIKSCISLAPKR